jgi:DNA-3-methyladenine glycosylase II
LRAVAAAIAESRLDLASLEAATPDFVHAHMTAVSGIGPWTADVYLLFCLGHRDGFAAGDLAVQEAAKVAFDLPLRPKAVPSWQSWPRPGGPGAASRRGCSGPITPR